MPNFQRKNLHILSSVTLPLILFSVILCSGCINKETNSPLGCNKQEGRYFDPERGVCVTTTSELQAYRLNAYRRVNQVVEDRITQAAFIVFFSKGLTNAEFVSLVSQLKSAHITSIGMVFPKIENGHNWGGHVNEGVELNKIAETAILDSLMKYSDSPEETAVFLNAIRKEEFSVVRVDFLAAPKDAMDWWDANRNSICVVRTNIDWFDSSQPNICYPGAEKNENK